MKRNLLILLFLGVFLGALDIAIIGPVKQPIMMAFAIGERQWPWAINLYLLLYLVATPLMSKLSDLLGRRWIYISSILLFAIGSLVVVFSSNFNVFIAGRAIQGFGAGGIFPVASAVIGDVVAKEKQGSALGLIGAVFGLAFIIGPPLGGLLLSFSWHWIFIINIPLALIVIVWAFRVVPSHKISDKIHFDWFGMLLMIASLVLFAFSTTRIDAKHLLDSLSQFNIWSLLLLSFLMIPIYIWWQNKVEHPILNPQLLKSRQLLLVYVLAFGAGLGEVAVMYLPGMAQQLFNLSNSASSYALIPLIGALFVGAPTSGRLLDKLGAKVVILTGTSLLSMGVLGFGLFSSTKFGFYSAEVCFGFGLSALLGAPLRYIMNQETNEDDRASGQGMITLFTSTGQIASAAIIGALIASFGSNAHAVQNTFLILVVVYVLFFVTALFLRKKEKIAN